MSESDDDATFASADEGDSPLLETKGNTEKKTLAKSEATGAQKNENKTPQKKSKSQGMNLKDKQKGVNTKEKNSQKEGKKGKTKQVSSKPQKKDEKQTDENITSEEKSKEEKQITDMTEKDLRPKQKNGASQYPSEDQLQITESGKKDTGSAPKPVTESKKVDTGNSEQKADTCTKKEKEEKSEGWSWGGWGSSFVAAASHSVSTFTNQLEEGLNTIVDAMENSLGAVSPEELARMKAEGREAEPKQENIERDGESKKEEDLASRIKEPQEKEEEEEEEEKGEEEPNKEKDDGWFSSWGMSSLSSVVQNTTNVSKNLMTGGLDVLESIGKKTFEVIKDHDPGLRKTRGVLFDWGEKPNLSAMLREAKEAAEEKMELEREAAEMRKAHFGSLFDDYQGLAHVEALEILSNRCEKKVHSLLGSMPIETLSTIKADLVQIKQEFERNEDQEQDDVDDHDFCTSVRDKLSSLQIGVVPEKLCECQETIRKELKECQEKVDKEEITAKEVHQHAIKGLAQFTAKSVELFHKTGEMVLLHANGEVTNKARAKTLSSLTDVFCSEVGILSSRYSVCLNKINEKEEDKTDINSLVTNIYLEAGNSSTYIQDTFQLILPCVQEAALQKAVTDSS